jgi:hypothetical protein
MAQEAYDEVAGAGATQGGGGDKGGDKRPFSGFDKRSGV